MHDNGQDKDNVNNPDFVLLQSLCLCLRQNEYDPVTARTGGVQQTLEITSFTLCFKLLASLPVSTATPERPFSVMKLLKTYMYMRSKLTDGNTQGLAQTH